MEANASTMQHSYGLGPRSVNPPHGAQQARGLHQPSAGPPGAPRPEEPHHKPFFYVQHSQPYVPVQSLQWPMPVSYNPYYGYPGLGYGMPMMPNYQPNPYMEPPGFVVPHTHLHLMDYRRVLNPQYYQTMAYHSRRFRYQQNSQTREMISSEVQTEPLSATQRTSTPGPSNVEAPVVLPDSSNNGPSVPTSWPVAPGLVVQKGVRSVEVKDMAPPATTRMSPKGSFVIQTEEVRIECRTTPVGLQLVHSHETADVSHSFSQDVVLCSSVLQGHVLPDRGTCLPADPSDQALQACPDILLVGAPNSSETFPTLEESSWPLMDPVTVASNIGSLVAANADVLEASSDKDQSPASKRLHCGVAHLPFDPMCLDELAQMESTVWLMEETLIPSPELLIQNDHMEFYDEILAVVAEEPSEDALMFIDEVPSDEAPSDEAPSDEAPSDEAPSDEAPSDEALADEALADEVVTMIEVPSLSSDELEDKVPTVEGPGDEMLSEIDTSPMTDVPVAEETPVTEVTHAAEVDHVPYSPLLDNPPLVANGNQHGGESNVQDHQDTSFESLPAYLPSTRWLEDFDNIYYGSKFPPPPKKQSRPLGSHGLDVPSRRRKLDLDYKEQSTVRKPKERYKPKGCKGDRRSLSDHECCLSRSFNENVFSPHASKRDRLCPRCLAKCRMYTAASPAADGRTLKRKASPFQQRNGALLPTCETCKCPSKRQLLRKGSSPDVRGFHYGHDTEGESSENSSSRTGNINGLMRPLASKQNLVTSPTEPHHHSAAWERLRHCPHGNTIRERDENRATPVSLQDKWRNTDQIYLTHRWHTAERSWKAVMPKPDADGLNKEAGSQHMNKHKKSQSQGTRRKVTRC